MTAELRRVMVCSPESAGWNDSAKSAKWPELGFQHPPNFIVAKEQHDGLCDLLRQSGAEVMTLPADKTFTLDAVYAHDASLPTDHGLLLMSPGKNNRVPEAKAHREFCERFGMPTFAEITAPGTSEAGDLVWLDHQTLLVGNGYRTNPEGIAQIRHLFSARDVAVLTAPLPYGTGPAACLHLMSLMSMLDERTILVDLPWMAVETVELLKSRSFRMIEIDYLERDTLACNVLALGRNRLIALHENSKTNQRLQEAGFEVLTFPGSELCINGGGGPTCLTRPLLRD